MKKGWRKKFLMVAAAAALLGGCGSEKEENVSLEELFEKDFVLYCVNCGADASDRIQGEYSMGLFQTISDQPYGADEGTGKRWGYTEQAYMCAAGDLSSGDPGDSRWEIREDAEYQEGMGFAYHFELDEGTYEVTCGFSNPFSARTVDVTAEGETAISELKILKYKDTQGVFEQKVTDGTLDLLVYNSKRGKDAMKNPVLSYLVIRAIPEYNTELLHLLLEQTTNVEYKLPEYTDTTAEAYQNAREAAESLARDAQPEQVEEAYKNLKKAYGELEMKTIYNSYRPGEVWLDQDGNTIQAHGGQVQKLTVTEKETGAVKEKWWWVGEDKTKGNRGGICAYSSDDLHNWNYEGVIMRNVSRREDLEKDEYFRELYGDYSKEQLDRVYECINDSRAIIERPKMIYNEKSGRYILWFHADGPTQTSNADYAAASAGVAVSDSPYGPFRFVDRYRLNVCPPDQEDMYPKSRGMARDMNLFVDDDKTAYIIYSSEENLTIYISKLNDTYDYLCTDPEKAVYGEDFIRLYPGAQREAPAMIKKDGRYYLMTSGATGWAPNQARYWMADEIFGAWEDKGDPCVGDEKHTTFDSQSTCIFAADEETIVYMGDRWNEDDLSDSRYIWLPLHFDADGNMSLEWQDEWNIEK